jgi:hypothetical protein
LVRGQQFSAAYGAQAKPLVVVNSPGGSIDEAIKIGRLLRKNELTVIGQECISACVLILAGAVSRGVVRVGIHRPYFEELDPKLTAAGVDQAYKAMFQEIRDYLSEMNVPTALADDMEATPPDEVKFLTEEEQTKFFLNQIDPAYMEKKISDNAQLFGISMDLYRQRYAQAKAACPPPNSPGASLSEQGAYLDCRQAIFWGLSQGEYVRRKTIFDLVVGKMNNPTEEQKRDCQISIIGKGSESCD